MSDLDLFGDGPVAMVPVKLEAGERVLPLKTTEVVDAALAYIAELDGPFDPVARGNAQRRLRRAVYKLEGRPT